MLRSQLGAKRPVPSCTRISSSKKSFPQITPMVIDPVSLSSVVDGIDFSGIKYCVQPSFNIKPGELLWVMLVADVKDRPSVVAMVELQQNPYDSNVVWFKFLEVAEPFRRKGLSKQLIELTASTFVSRYLGKSVEFSSFTDRGLKYLRVNLLKVFGKFGISIVSN